MLKVEDPVKDAVKYTAGAEIPLTGGITIMWNGIIRGVSGN